MVVHRVIGCMTGTSCDGLDLAYVISNGSDKLNIGPAITIPFDEYYKNILRQRVTMGVARHFMDDKLAKTIANYHAHHIKEFIRHHQLEVDAIGFHGQTVLHDPANGITVQLGDCQFLANQLNIQVVGQMRLNDVENGGQGAPLAPIYHQAISAKLSKPTAFLNIGGIANITFIGEKTLIAGDIGPGNALLDDWMQKHNGVAQDTNGEYAKKGSVDQTILDHWLQDSFFKQSLPKSLDRMHFHNFLNDCQKLSVEDGAATLTRFTALSVLKCFDFLPEKPKQLIICGGGCHNPVLMAQLQEIFINAMTISELGFNSDAIESQLMAYLAARFFKKLPSSFPCTTGVLSPTVAGQLFLPE